MRSVGSLTNIENSGDRWGFSNHSSFDIDTIRRTYAKSDDARIERTRSDPGRGTDVTLGLGQGPLNV